MPSFDDCRQEIVFLTRSSTRVAILRDLYNDGPLETKALQRRFNCDRTTLHRNLDALVEHGWIELTHDRCRITQAGKLLAEGLFDLTETTGNAIKLEPFLRWMPANEFDIDVELLGDANIILATNNPYMAVSQIIDVLKRAERFHGLIPTIDRHLLETTWGRVSNNEGNFRVVIPATAVDVWESESGLRQTLDKLLASSRVSLFMCDCTLPFYLGLTDDIVQIGVDDEDGILRAIAETEHRAIRRWAETSFQQYEQQATALASELEVNPEIVS